MIEKELPHRVEMKRNLLFADCSKNVYFYVGYYNNQVVYKPQKCISYNSRGSEDQIKL